MSTEAEAKFCPNCGSASVDFSTLVGGEASCNACSWKGISTQLVVFPFKHEMGSEEEVARAFANDVRRVVGDMATPLAQLLAKWGFIDAKPPTREDKLKLYTKELTFYITEAARAVAISFITTRQQIEMEKGRRGHGRR